MLVKVVEFYKDQSIKNKRFGIIVGWKNTFQNKMCFITTYYILMKSKRFTAFSKYLIPEIEPITENDYGML